MLRFAKIFPLFIVVVALSVGCAKSSPPQAEPTAPYTTPLHIANQTIFVEVADNSKTREQGLSGRDRLTDAQGMLFDFRDTNITQPTFWMKGMRFALDFVWIKDSKIIGITREAPVENRIYDNDYKTYPSPGPVDEVLEVNAGWAGNHHLKIGDAVNF